MALLFGCTKSSIQAGKRTWRWFFGCGSWQYPLLWFLPRNDVLTKFLEEELLPHLFCQLWKTTGFWKSRVRSGGNQKSQSASENFWWIEIVPGKIILMLGKNDHETVTFVSGSAERHGWELFICWKTFGVWRMDHHGYFIRRLLVSSSRCIMVPWVWWSLQRMFLLGKTIRVQWKTSDLFLFWVLFVDLQMMKDIGWVVVVKMMEERQLG